MRHLKSLSFGLLLFIFTSFSEASPWSVGVKGGFGGTGIKKTVSVESSSVDANRSEGPGVVGFSIEKVLSSRWTLGFEHRRGFRLGPLSSGVGFTDATWRWYYLGAAVAPIHDLSSSYYFRKRWAPFLGVATGFAFGTISREADKINRVKSSGVVVGTKIGADFHYKNSMIIRPELVLTSTFVSSGGAPASMSEFGLMCGMIIPY